MTHRKSLLCASIVAALMSTAVYADDAADAANAPKKAQAGTADENLETIVVKGIRESLQRSIDVKREASSHVEVITAEAVKPWDRMVFEESFREFRMQAQYYNQDGRHYTFGDLKRYVPGSENLHFLVSAAVSGYIHQLDEKIPDIVNSLGKQFLSFSRFNFEIINSDLRDIAKHQVAISFVSDPMRWIDTVADHLLLAGAEDDEGETLTHMVQLRPFFSIYSISDEIFETIARKNLFG